MSGPIARDGRPYTPRSPRTCPPVDPRLPDQANQRADRVHVHPNAAHDTHKLISFKLIYVDY